ncbi:MAG: hypothetical protein Q8O19_05775 [Rectinemataceae bacterium]|nr:hypothetical protein [Rectinemataceae bacterium]
MDKEVKMVIGAAGFLIVLGFASWSTGYFGRTNTPPLVSMTLSQPGCEFIARSGIATEVKNGICTITVRYRSYRLSDGGTIEKRGAPPIAIGSGQIVGMTELDDGSDEPWSTEHKKAFGIWIVTLLIMLFISVLMLLDIKSRGKK